MAKKQVDTPYKGSWADQQSKSEVGWSIEHAKNAPVIFQSANVTWYVKRFGGTREEACAALGYSQPIATIKLAEYRELIGLKG